MLVAVAVGLLAAAMAPPAYGQQYGRDQRVVDWINRHAVALASTDPRDPVDDLRALRQLVGPASVVGLGESSHGSREQFRLKHRMVRFLVERMGFRTVGLEHDFAHGVVLDRYVMTGKGDPRALVADMGFPFWICEEILDLVRWMRSYNVAHGDKVRFLGTDVIALRTLSFDELTRYVRHVAPDRLAELERHLAPIRPTRPDHTSWYQGLPENERRRLIDSARRADEVVRGVPATAPRLDREYAEQHARTILGWYDAFNNLEFAPQREVFIADTIGWWQRQIGGGRVAYWAANFHTTSAPSVTYRHSGGGWTGKTAGGYLKERLGRRYVAIGSVFHHGAISSDFANPSPHPVGPPPPGLLDATLGRARPANYLLDLRAPAPRPVRAWRTGPAAKRMILPSYTEDNDASGYVMTVPSLIGALDAVVHIRTTTPSRLLGGQ
jgi:erythromycin esterase